MAVAKAHAHNHLSLNVIRTYFYVHAQNLTKSAQNQKTYRRLFGMIFLEGSELLLVAYKQWFETLKTKKNSQNAKKNVFFFGVLLIVKLCDRGDYVDCWNPDFLIKIQCEDDAEPSGEPVGAQKNGP